MSTRKQPSNIVRRLVKQVWRLFQSLTKTLINWFLRSVFVLKRRSRLSQAGFVLPTVVMVMLVVMLLTTAILIRSFNRPKNASNMRVDQATYNAAAPALDRARAKLQQLFSPEETDLKGNTPDESSIATAFENEKYTFGDEKQLKLVFDYLTIDRNTGDVNAQTPDGTITPTVSNKPSPEQLQTAWKFPVDTDNDGKFDSFTLYGIFYRTPPLPANPGDYSRPRQPLEARSIPQDDGQAQGCSSGSNDTAQGWYKTGGQLKKAFFTYVATVPITNITGLDTKKYQTYTGNKGFAALEAQQDQARIALDNNAVWYNDDIEIINPTPFNLNGRVHTNGNLLVANDGDPITFWQVSSPYSCYYLPENSKISIGGNVAAGGVEAAADSTNNDVTLHLYNARNQAFNPTNPANYRVINNDNKTTTLNPAAIAYNTEAYAARIKVLVDGTVAVAGRTATYGTVKANTRFPEEIRSNLKDKCKDTDPCPNFADVLSQTGKDYFEARLRRVPYAEVPIDDTTDKAVTANGGKLTGKRIPAAGYQFVFSGGGQLAAPEAWMRIEDPNSGNNVTGYTEVPLKFNGSAMDLETTQPKSGDKKEYNIGDRIIVGNGLPERWLLPGKTGQAPEDYADKGKPQDVKNGTAPVHWNDQGGGDAGLTTPPRQRQSSVEPVTDLGDTSRDGYWENAAAFDGKPLLENQKNTQLLGGLRVVTGAGIYVDGDSPVGGRGTGKRESEDTTPGKGDVRSFLPPTPSLAELTAKGIQIPDFIKIIDQKRLIVVWPDTMPMYNKPVIGGQPFRKGDLQMRATVVYHYAQETGKDQEPIACISSYYDPTNRVTADNANNISNNGINYSAAGLKAKRESIDRRLRKQALMIFPDGRMVNERLYKAINKTSAERSLAENAALDAAHCALQILDNPAATVANAFVPDGAIKEATFLDARQVKALHKPERLDSNTGTPTVNPDTLLKEISDPKQLEIAELPELETLTGARYDLPIEQRQPLEIRVTEINLDTTPTQGITRVPGPNGEFMVPNSGIIYATRDDALPDLSSDYPQTKTRNDYLTNLKASAKSGADFKLDPTRRPNGIRLIKGLNLSRNPNYTITEKGFILASDLPVYIKGDFNMHYTPGNTSGPQIEEFPTALAADYGNFYNRGVDVNPNSDFACRSGGGRCGSSGDQWRAARILSDAITIQSKDFKDGFRSDGDYDLNNNAGNWAVESRLKNGFWWNGFATSGNAYDAGNPKRSSYVMNDVTPIQRRAKFTEYQMEICKKLPVSACGPTDWTTTGAGTTVQPAPTEEDRIYPRRVAFERDRQTGQLILEAGKAKPKIASGEAQKYDGNPVPAPVADALWFWTSDTPTAPNAGIPPTNAPITGFNYGAGPSRPLYYLPEEPEVPTLNVPVVQERQLLLPGTPIFPANVSTDTTVADKLNALNGKTDQDPSDYAVCMRTGFSQSNTPATLTSGQCPALPTIRQARTALAALAATTPDASGKSVVSVTTWSGGKLPLPLAKVNIYDLPTGATLSGTITFNQYTQPDQIFVFRSPDTITFNDVKLKLQGGVAPNNIFWVSTRGMTVNGTLPAPQQLLAGNFLGGTGRLKITAASILKGVRFLGFLGAAPTFPTAMTAMKTTDQPLLVPVLQLHSPSPTIQPENSTAAFGGDLMTNTWLPPATDINVNAVLIMGDSPSRPIGANVAESGGGLQNFPRFMEKWDGKNTKIQGSFIQFKRSVFATAPFEAIENPTRDNSLFFDQQPTPDYMARVSSPNKDFRYRGGGSTQKAPYYMPPTRQWGYDVGLLSQSPDLFSTKFATPSAGTPSEYYREVGRDDLWVKNLLCAAENTGGTTPTYNQYAINDPQQRPPSCRNIGDYQ